MGKRVRTIRTTILSFPGSRKSDWQSLNEIFPSIERAWEASSDPNHPVEILRLSNVSPLELVPKLLLSDRIVFPQFGLLSAEASQLVRMLRKQFGCKAAFVFHLHGDGTKAAAAFEGIRDLLLSRDGFIAASEADAKAFRLCYPKARILVAPFPLAEKRHPRKPGHRRATPFWYCGRISEQKNLHTVLLALHLLRKTRGYERVKFEIFGAQDRLGSPNMGLKSREYEKFLRKLTSDLGLDSVVRWRGFVDQSILLRKMRSTPHIFVSASLHSDENFGVASLKSISLGNTAVLSEWGGHRDFSRCFGSQVQGVPVTVTSHGPVVEPAALARALASSLSHRGKDRRKASAYSLRSVGKKLRAFMILIPSRGQPLRESSLAATLHARRFRETKKIFRGYDDPLVRPFFEAYAASRPFKAKDAESIWVPPWVSVHSNEVRIVDPHRGSFRRKVSGTVRRKVPVYDFLGRRTMVNAPICSWLLRSGWAFQC